MTLNTFAEDIADSIELADDPLRVAEDLVQELVSRYELPYANVSPTDDINTAFDAAADDYKEEADNLLAVRDSIVSDVESDVRNHIIATAQSATETYVEEQTRVAVSQLFASAPYEVPGVGEYTSLDEAIAAARSSNANMLAYRLTAFGADSRLHILRVAEED